VFFLVLMSNYAVWIDLIYFKKKKKTNLRGTLEAARFLLYNAKANANARVCMPILSII